MFKIKNLLLAATLACIGSISVAQTVVVEPVGTNKQASTPVENDFDEITLKEDSVIYKCEKGTALDKLFNDWAVQSGYEFYWKFPEKFPDIVFEKDFQVPANVLQGKRAKDRLVLAYTYVLKSLNIDKKVSFTIYNDNNSIVMSPR